MSAPNGSGSVDERLAAIARRLERLEERVARLEGLGSPSDTTTDGGPLRERRRALPNESEQPRSE